MKALNPAILNKIRIVLLYSRLLTAVVKCENRSDNTIISIGLHINVVMIVTNTQILFCCKNSKI